MFTQMRLFDGKRLLGKMGKLNVKQFDEVRNMLKEII